jgi:phosphatidylinositol alpha-1,6-mannosyltransferase
MTGQSPIDEIDTLLRAFSTVRTWRKGAVLILVGGVRSAKINGLARELGIEAGLRFVRSIPDGEMPDLYRLADVFVLAGREDRKLGMVDGIQFAALEALASGVPVVGARTRTTEELIAEGEVGLLVDPGSPGKLARAIQDVLHPVERRAGFAERARRRAEREWDAAVAAARMREIFEVVYYRRLRRGPLPRPVEIVEEISTSG